MDDRTDRIKAEALRLGFTSVGIAPAVELTGERERLRQWLDLGYHASMEWMRASFGRRTNPGLVLEGARSVISLAMNYYTPLPHENGPGAAKISRYAWGDDYHEVIGDRLKQFEAFLAEILPGIHTRSSVDSGPMMDKAWAVRSGIGWLGKHSNVISRQWGSWIFLAEVVLDAELTYDGAMADHCGTCTACLEACPTGAITQPYVVDANRCISYLTIEHRGELPEALIPKFEGWVFGCDICQDVCPWNRFAKPTAEPAFEPREANRAPHAAELAQLTRDDYTQRFRRSPVKRAKYEGVVRNARALNTGESSAACVHPMNINIK